VLLDHLVQEAADRACRLGTDEAGDRLAVAEDRNGRDALYPVARREGLLGVDVDLGEDELAVALLDLRLDSRAERAAGAAPGSPEVDDNRQLT
jgi:hypothetical protein